MSIAETMDAMLEAVVAWARLVAPIGTKVFKGGEGATEVPGMVTVLARSSLPQDPAEVVPDDTVMMHSQTMVTTVELAAWGGDDPRQTVRQMGTAWTSMGEVAAPLREALVVPVGSAGSYVDGYAQMGSAGIVPKSVVTIAVRHRIGWRKAAGVPAEVTEISGTLTGYPTGAASFSVTLATVLQVNNSLLTVGPLALRIDP